nr:MAG TPA: hypothetical protein [Caudoviricetes sp.]
MPFLLYLRYLQLSYILLFSITLPMKALFY